MGIYWFIACRECKEMLGLHKLSEPDNEKKEALWEFIKNHTSAYCFPNKEHHLKIVGDDCADGEIIINTESGWTTEYKVYYPEDYIAYVKKVEE